MGFVVYENNRKYIITTHCRQRYSERVLNKPFTGRLTPEDEKALVKMLYESPEEKTWVNNLNFVHHLKTTYGNHKIKILKQSDFRFICHETDIKNHYSVITVYNSTKYEWGKICQNKIEKVAQIISTQKK